MVRRGHTLAVKTPQDQQLIDLRHRGATWAVCAAQLGSTSSSLRERACHLRDAKCWTLADGSHAKHAPSAGKLGRPPNKIPTIPVSARFAPDVADALRTVAHCAGVRLGVVIGEALRRFVAAAEGRRLEQYPLGLDPGQPFDLVDHLRSETISVNVPAPVYRAVQACASRLLIGMPINSVVMYAAHALLQDLNYRFVRSDK